MKKSLGTSLRVNSCHGLTTVLVGANKITLEAPDLKLGTSHFLIVAFEQAALAGVALSAMAIRNSADSADLATFDPVTLGPTTGKADAAIVLSLDEYLALGAGDAGVINFLFTPASAPDSYSAMIISIPTRQPAGAIDGNGGMYYLTES